jgi:preprotein translocase subunit SecG
VLILIAAELVWFAGVVALLLTALALMVWFVCSLVYGAVSSYKCRSDSDGLSR